MPAGRPITLDETKKAQICSMLAVGCSRATAARYVGCCVKTIRNAADADPLFQEQVEHAEAEAIKNAIDSVQAAAKTSWRAAAWLLQTLTPRRYHRRAGVKPPRPAPSAQSDLRELHQSAAWQTIARRIRESNAKAPTE